jgi:hypothetical protein
MLCRLWQMVESLPEAADALCLSPSPFSPFLLDPAVLLAPQHVLVLSRLWQIVEWLGTAADALVSHPNMLSLDMFLPCRLWQIVEWLAEAADGDVLIVLDECHRAKNLVATEGRSTKTGIAVLALQNALPNARWGVCLRWRRGCACSYLVAHMMFQHNPQHVLYYCMLSPGWCKAWLQVPACPAK